jgi:hypothetical protein
MNEQTKIMPVQEALQYLERIRAMLLAHDNQGAFNYTEIVIRGLKDGEL